ncbi:hypothetical protein Pla123a_39980 [Posidoniimonas polymericola]|uniref:Uncharacterized protein n=1 Tax=Posidoniimonas polymericola TaxID=2528002 RepID=A0A5C5YCM6_9BACT|nr:hypothetical protein [Posidoniimonas polymericola]TWT72699.1 hypothetical protein Pla123a_39980 [Posidoniimonas polymericola]
MKSAIVGILVGIGVVLFVLSLVWTQIFTGESRWTPEKADQWAEVKDRLHNLSFIVNSPEPPRRHASREEAQAEYDKVKAMANQLRSEFENAYDGPRTTATVLKWSGVGVLVLGIGLQFAWKDQG